MDKKVLFILLSLISFSESLFGQNDSSYVRTEKSEATTTQSKKVREREGSPIKEKLFVGFYPGISWSNYAFTYEFSPIVGLELFPKFYSGVGAVYKHTNGKDYDRNGYLFKYKVDNVGFRVFGFYDVYKNFCAYVEYEGVQLTYKDDYDKFTRWNRNLNAGLLYKSPLGNKAEASLLVLYNFLYDDFDRDIGNSPLNFRFGFIFYPFRSNSY
jgi:hypothetical protein